MELREYVRAIRRRWRLILVMVVLTVGVTAAVTARVPPTYRASTVLFISTSVPDSGPDTGTDRVNSYIALVTGPRIASAVNTTLRLPLTVKQTQKKITAEVRPGTNLLVVTATDSSPTVAGNISVAAANRLVGIVRELEPPQPNPTPPPATLPPPVRITIAQDAVTTRAPTNLPRNLAFAAVLGLLLGAAGTALRETQQKAVTSERDLRRCAALETVGVISLRSETGRARRGRARHPDGALAEAFRKLRTRLPYPTGRMRGVTAPVSLLVTSSVPREGTTAIACGLAIAMAETGSRVVLVDANMREPGVGGYLALDATRGLADVLATRASIDDVLCDWGNGRLRVLPAGYAALDPGELLAGPALADTIGTLENRFDFVVIDAPPLLSVADAAVIGKLADGVLLVVRANRTRTEQVERAADMLRGIGVRIVGGVLNALPKRMRGAAPWRRTDPVPQWRAPEAPTALLATPADEVDPADAGLDDVGTVRGRASVPRTTALGRARVAFHPDRHDLDPDDEQELAADVSGEPNPVE